MFSGNIILLCLRIFKSVNCFERQYHFLIIFLIDFLCVLMHNVHLGRKETMSS